MYDSPQSFYDATIGKSINTDGYYGAQCWDYFDFFCSKEGVTCSRYCALTGYAGDLYKLRYQYGYDKFFEFFYPRHAQRGDWYFSDHHVAMVWDVYDDGTVLLLGQNQGGIKRVTLKKYKLSDALGMMRWKGWIKKMTGWVKSGNHWYYFDKDGNKVTGWKVLPWSKGKDWFYFDKNGVMQTGWITHKGGLYYCDETNGTMLTGSHTMTLQFGKDGGLI